MVTNKEVYSNGFIIEHYPCDVNESKEVETNGSIENVVEYNGKKYYVITDWQNNVRWENEAATEI